MAQSCGIFDATRFARPCEVSRPTIANYLRVLEATFVVHVIRPSSARRTTEIVAAPTVYGFDTGFICYYRDWQELRDDDLGILWEHFVLNEITARFLLARQARTRSGLYTCAPPKESYCHRVQMVLEQLRFRQSPCLPAPASRRQQSRPRSRCRTCLYPELRKPEGAI